MVDFLQLSTSLSLNLSLPLLLLVTISAAQPHLFTVKRQVKHENAAKSFRLLSRTESVCAGVINSN
jgi:hypothetical protein